MIELREAGPRENRASRPELSWPKVSGQRPQSYDATWAFRKRKALEPYKSLLHAVWCVLFAALRLGGDCFKRRLLAEEILNQNVLLLARR